MVILYLVIHYYILYLPKKDFLVFPYYIYRINNNIYLEINLNDFLVSKYITRNEEGKIVISDRSAAGILLIDIITDSLARAAVKETIETGNELNGNNVNIDIFVRFEKIKSMLTPKLYDIIVTNNMGSLSIS